MESILLDINDDDEMAKLLAVVLYDEESSLRGYLQITDHELVTAIVFSIQSLNNIWLMSVRKCSIG